jgi:chemotaxis protein MotB
MSLRPIIIKKIKKTEGGHHGGAWKVAYADFVTAMMAFFLLMWLLNATTEKQRSGIADYFDPKIPISQSSAGGVNMFNGDSVFAQNKLARNGLGGSGKQAAAGRDDKQRHEVSESEKNVWSKAQKEETLIGNKKQEFTARKTDNAKSDVNKDTMSAHDIEQEIKKSLEAVNGNGLTKHLNFKMTDEGLRIDITDGDKSPMFETGSDVPTPKMKKIIAVVGNVLSLLVNKIAITGHTDSSPITGKRNYSNWELSSDRANAARRELLSTGIEEASIKRIEGRADTQPFIEDKPNDLQNRRIGIILLKDNSTEAMKKAVLDDKKQQIKEKEQQEKIEKSKITQPDIGEKNRNKENSFVPDPLAFQ